MYETLEVYEVRAMSTLLNYGTAAKPRAPKAVSKTGQDDGFSGISAPMKPLPSPPTAIMQTAVPPIHPTAPISSSQLRRRSKKPRTRPSSNQPSPQQQLPKRPDETFLGPPPTTAPRESEAQKYSLADESSVVLTATLFPRVKSPPIPLRQPAEGLKQSSSRIQGILETKQVGRLAVPTDAQTSTKDNRRISIGLTPISAYGGHDNSVTTLPFVPKSGPWASGREMALTPIEMDLGALEVIASLPEASRPMRKQSLARQPWSKSVYHLGRRGPVVAVELPGGSLMTVITPESSAWQRAPYLMGDIRPEPKAKPARSPMAILQPEQEKLLAEQAIVDDLVSFIRSYGDIFCSGNTNLDRYWLDEGLTALHIPPATSNMSPPSVETKVLESPDLPRVTKRDSKTMARHNQAETDIRQISGKYGLPSPAKIDRESQLPSDRFRPSPRLPASVARSPPPGRHLFNSSASQESSGLLRPGSPFSESSGSPPRKDAQGKGQGANATGQKISLRGLIRSAASIV